MQEVSVVLGSQSYDIHIGEGFLDQLEVLMQSFSFSKRGLLISDSNVALLYGDKLLNILNQNGFAFDLFVVHAGEQAKSFNIAANLGAVTTFLPQERFITRWLSPARLPASWATA